MIFYAATGRGPLQFAVVAGVAQAFAEREGRAKQGEGFFIEALRDAASQPRAKWRKSPQKGLQDGLPVLRDSAIRQLWDTATDDPNVFIGDEAFARREMFDFDRVGKPGECIEIVPALRKSARWLPGQHDYSGQHELLPVGLPLSSMTSCIAVQKSESKITIPDQPTGWVPGTDGRFPSLSS